LTVDFSLDGRVEGSGHASHREFGREGLSGVHGVGSILQADRLDTNEVVVAAGADGGIWGENDGRGG